MAQTQLYRSLAQVTVAKESVTQDTYITPVAADVILAQDVEFSYEADNWQPDYVRADGLRMDSVMGPVSARMTFRVPLKGSGGTAGTAPECGEALKACGLKETVVASTSVTYTPTSLFTDAGGNPAGSYSASFFVNGIRHACRGAFANLQILAEEVGRPAFLQFEFMGAYQAVADVALLTPTYDNTAPPAFVGAAFAVNYGGAFAGIKGVSSFTLNLNNRLTMGRDANHAQGFYGARIVPGGRASGSFSVEQQLVAGYDWWAKALANTAGTIVTGVIGSTAGNRWQAKVNRSTLGFPALADREGISGLDIAYMVSSLVTDTEAANPPVELIFT